jgi:hypothetical protein
LAGDDVFLVFVDGKPGHEEAYARWFCGDHMGDMRALHGVNRAFAGRLTGLDGEPPPAQLCGYYETLDCGALLNTIAASKGTPALPVSDLQGRMVWRVLETVGGHSDPGADTAGMMICLLPGEADEAREGRLLAFLQAADLPIAGARLTRIGAIQPARGREFGSVLFASLPDEADPAAVAAMIAERCGTEGARFLLASASKPG